MKNLKWVINIVTVCSITAASHLTTKRYSVSLEIYPQHTNLEDTVTFTCNASIDVYDYIYWRYDGFRIGVGCTFNGFISWNDIKECTCNGVPSIDDTCAENQTPYLLIELRLLISNNAYFGTWYCTTDWDWDEESLYKIVPVGTPTITPPEEDLVTDEVAFFFCTAADGVPDSTIAWFITSSDADRNVTDSSTVVRNSTFVTSILEYTVQKSDNGDKIYCTATQYVLDPMEEMSNRVSLEIFYQPLGYPLINSDSRVISVEEMEMVTCNISSLDDPGNPSPQFYIWELDEILVANVSNSNFTFVSSNVGNSGKYTCRAGNFVGTSERSHEINITVEAKGTIEVHDCTTTTPVYRKHESDNLIFTCVISSTNVPEQNWTKSGSPVNSEDFLFQDVDEIKGNYSYGLNYAYEYAMKWRAEEKNFTCSDINYYDGEYACNGSVLVAGETDNIVSDSINIATLYPAIYNASTTWVTAEIGNENVSLHCTVCAYPPPLYYNWFHNEILISESTYDNYIISTVIPTSFGEYICEVTNYVGKTNHTLTLMESGPPKSPDELQVLENITSMSITLTWNEVTHGGWPPITYTIEISETTCNSTDDYRSVSQITGPVDSHLGFHYVYIIYHLEASRLYHVRIRASNTWHGNNPHSDYTYKCDIATRESPVIHLTRAEVRSSILLRAEWTYNISMPGNAYVVTIRVIYSSGGSETVYPDIKHPALLATDRFVDVPGSFSEKMEYSVYLKVYENNNAIESFSSTSAQIEAEKLSAGAVVAITLIVLLFVAVVAVVLLVYIGRLRITIIAGNENKTSTPYELNHQTVSEEMSTEYTDLSIDRYADTPTSQTSQASQHIVAESEADAYENASFKKNIKSSKVNAKRSPNQPKKQLTRQAAMNNKHNAYENASFTNSFNEGNSKPGSHEGETNSIQTDQNIYENKPFSIYANV